MWQAQAMAYGKGETPKRKRSVFTPLRHMVKSRMTVIRVDGRATKERGLDTGIIRIWKADIYLSPFLFPGKVRPGFIFYGEKHTVIESRKKERI